MKRPKKPDDLSVALDEIGDSGYHISRRRHQSWVAESLLEEKAIACDFAGDIGIELDFFKTGTTVIVRGAVTTTLQLRCVRCLADFTFPLAVSFHYNLLPEQGRKLPQEMEIPREEFDAYYYSGTVVDLAPMVLEQIVLHIPANPLCRDACRGICQYCGEDLNRGTCHCPGGRDEPSPFAALKDFNALRNKKC